MKKIILILLMIITLSSAKSITNSIDMKFVKIPSGSFMMGTQPENCPQNNPLTELNERDRCLINIRDELPYHKESVGSFYMQTTEVTQYQWYKIMENNPAHFKTERLGYNSKNNPIENVSWEDAKEFIKRLNSKEKTDKYRLPTEIEWEYAARAGSRDKWCFGNSESLLGNYAWTRENSEYKTHPVAKKQPNSWGLYDMHGNVWEWTSSCYTQNYNENCYNNKNKVLRGGSWYNHPSDSRSAVRGSDTSDFRVMYSGFRLVRIIKEKN